MQPGTLKFSRKLIITIQDQLSIVKPIKWEASLYNQFKVNFDGAISHAKDVYGVGIANFDIAISHAIVIQNHACDWIITEVVTARDAFTLQRP